MPMINEDEEKRIRKRMSKPLTEKQFSTLVLITDGKTNNESAEILGISVKTFEKRRADIIRRMGTSNLALITKVALRRKLISL